MDHIKITDRPEFKRWFSGSKIVDKDGNPLRVYHGTVRNFTEFAVGQDMSVEGDEEYRVGSGPDPITFIGSHFAKEADVAGKFARGMYGERSGARGYTIGGGNIVPVYLRIKNPFVTNETDMLDVMYAGNYSNVMSVEQAVEEYAEDESEADGNPDVVWSWYDEEVAWRHELNTRAMTIEKDYDEPVYELSREMADRYQSDLRAKGYDGVIYDNEVEGGTSYIIFEPNQAKSALVGKFTESPDIRESVMNRSVGRLLRLIEYLEENVDEPAPKKVHAVRSEPKIDPVKDRTDDEDTPFMKMMKQMGMTSDRNGKLVYQK